MLFVLCVCVRREKSLEAYQAQTSCVIRMQHEIKTLRAIVSLARFFYLLLVDQLFESLELSLHDL